MGAAANLYTEGWSLKFGHTCGTMADGAQRLEQHIGILVLIFERLWLAMQEEGRLGMLDGHIGQIWRGRLQDCIRSIPELEREVDTHFVIWAVFVLVSIFGVSRLSVEESKELLRALFTRCPRRLKSWELTMESLKELLLEHSAYGDSGAKVAKDEVFGFTVQLSD